VFELADTTEQIGDPGMQLPMKSVQPSRNSHGEELFTPDLSEGAEVGVYLALLELIDEGLIITGDEYIIDANSAACRLLGRSYRQLVGQPLVNLFADEHAFLEARERLLIRGEARGMLRLALPDGRVHDFPYIAAPRLRPGIHAIVLDHERLSAEATGWPLTLHFQPQVDARSGMLHAGEALLRWQPPVQDSQAFDHFSAATLAVAGASTAHAQEAGTDAGVELDAWALSIVCRAATTWPHVRGHAPVVSINISAGQLPGGSLPKLVRTALAVSRLDPRSLELSIDARALLFPEADIAPTLRALAEMRVRLALDNFARNQAMIAQLSRYRFDVLKLDAALVAQLGHDDDDTAFIETIIRMSAPLGIRVMARGVQGRAQQDFLLALGCDLQQGPFIGAAQDEHVFAGFLSERLFC
jgi:EAL domain-containing protein (putative c-di-GMP-specific phosphodiesterase class I)